MQKFSRAFTLIEVLLAVTIFSFVAVFAVYLYVDTVHNDEKISFERELYEEARYTLERVVSELRQGTVDYAEYWNMSHENSCSADLNGNGTQEGDDFYEDNFYGEYGSCYQFYAASFYDTNSDGDPVFFENINGKQIALEHLGTNGSENAISEGAQDELYIINADGNLKTILRRRGNKDEKPCSEIDRSENSTEYCRLEILRMEGRDTDVDGKVDSWICTDDFGGEGCTPEESFRPISTPNIDITDLQFFIAPVEDPYKSYNEDIENNLQPHVTIIFSSRTPERRMSNMRGEAPHITIQTTVSARVYEEVTLYNNY